ncbi:hypothetical protein G7Z17_g9068 [Cylindrodendrum hubeiense]|uniref:NACHT domain-containing protein n=1 Tax=Cylindrodendrum hubeiense TaxID=595255 RepID=A0A9P5LDQ1_9HYPO|nr:hypothetical protein G7Z17_g9068 [Cylindrodendrum hubeiense]
MTEMDPLSTSASIIAVIQLSSEVVKYINATVEATKERRRLRDEVRACEYILQQLKDEADDSAEGKAWLETIKALEAPDAPLGRLWTALNVVKAKLQPKVGHGKILASLKWPFEENEIEKVFGTIEREKSLLQLALHNNFRKLVQEINRTSIENRKQLMELIQVISAHSGDSEYQLSELKDGLTFLQISQAGLHSGLDGLHRLQDNREAIEERQSILNWLTPVEYAAQQSDFIGRRQRGTGQWLLDSPEFKAWLSTAKQTLFCPGIPGAGKTILTSIVIEELTARFRNNEDVGVAYLYCNFRRQDEQKAEDLLLSLLKQLSQGMASIPRSVVLLHDKHKELQTRPSFEEISGALQSVADLYSRSFIVIDALDECQTSGGCRTRLLEEILSLKAKCGTNFFVTSRSIPEINEWFNGGLSLEIRASPDDVRRYVDGHIPHLPSFVGRNPGLQEDIRSETGKAVDGMYVTLFVVMSGTNPARFLLAKLHLDSLVGKRSPKAVRAALSKLPSGSEAYERAYKDAMERIEGQVTDQEELAKQVLSWVTLAKRPLKTSEIQHALAVEVGESELDEDNLPQVEDMVSVCAGLVTVDKESDIIRLVHYTTQAYFERTQKQWFPNAESDMATICVTYLSFGVFESGFCQTDAELEDRLRSNQLYDYAAHNWGHHAREAYLLHEKIYDCDFLISEAKLYASSQALMAVKQNLGSREYSQRVPRKMTGLHLAAYFGVEGVVTYLLSGGHEPDVKETCGRTPLSWAAENGHDAVVVRLLATTQVNADSKDKWSQTPLFYAAANSHEVIVKLLLRNGANVDSKNTGNYSQRTPLLYAAANGYADIAKALLENGAAVDSNDVDGKTPLVYASMNGHEAIMQLLFDKGASLDWKDKDDRTLLSWAAQNGHDAAVQLLLNKGADLESKDKDSRTPLSWAAQTGYIAIIRLLINFGADVESMDVDGQTPLLWASLKGHEEVVQLLSDQGADLEAKDIGDQTPLLWAVANGHDGVVRLLLNKGADAESEDVYGRTPLSLAAYNGHGEVVQLLLDKGADVESEDVNGQTPLSWAAYMGCEAIVRQLLEKGADLESKDKRGQTAVTWAARKGHNAVVRHLVEQGADLESKDVSGQTPLSWAAYMGCEAIVRQLLEKGAELESKDANGRTPVAWAARNGHDAVVRHLFEKGADLMSKDTDGRTPLSWADFANRNKAIAQLPRVNMPSPSGYGQPCLGVEGKMVSTPPPSPLFS